MIDGDVVLNASLWQSETYDVALEKLQAFVADTLERCVGTDYVLALGSLESKDFRDDLYPDYKQIPTRVKGRENRPDYYLELKHWLANQPDTLVANLS